MTLGSNFDGSGWYDDPLTASTGGYGGDNVNDGKAWTYGKEVWCNLEGRYMHIVADLNHLQDTYG